MGYFEEIALGSISLKPSLWLRLVNDTFIQRPNQEDIWTLLDHMNSIRSSIEFTMEEEKDNWLSFLDVLITHTEQEFSLSGYHNPTFTRENLTFHSHHLYNEKKGIVCCLQQRAKAISRDSNAYQEERKSLGDALHHNNYPESITSTPRNLNQTTENNTRKLTKVCLPFVKDQTKKFKRYVVHMISGQYLEVAWLFKNIFSESSPQHNTTWIRIVCTPCHTVVVKYTKVRHGAH